MSKRRNSCREPPRERPWRLVAAAMVALGLAFVPAIALTAPHVDGEVALEQRLMAPCCWVQTLDIHDSPIAKELRGEIHTRLSHGETSAAIEADLVQRYGERIVAMPASNPLGKVAAVVAAAVIAAGFLVVRALRRWTRRNEIEANAEKSTKMSGPDEWDERLDDELRE